MTMRKEHDSMGEVLVPDGVYWGAQTERSRQNFPIGGGRETMPAEIIRAFGYLKKGAALANAKLVPDKMTQEKCSAVCMAADEVINGRLDSNFPLVVFQTGSGTQTNMNANEVISARGNELSGNPGLLHPNDDVNMSQSSNDTFPSAMHISAVCIIEEDLLPSLDSLISSFDKLENDNLEIIKCGRTHLQDAVPLRFSQEVSGWKTSLMRDRDMISESVDPLRELALGGTAVGTGLNAPKGFDILAAEAVSELTGHRFETASNKFHSLSSKDEIVFSHGALKALAADLMKIANDIRWLSSGPRCGLGEIEIPENEPGSSIMPGKVNPTQCESVTMVAVQVMGNDAAIGFAASQGNFELNVFMPVIIDNYLRSARLLAGSIKSFRERCVSGIRPKKEKMLENLNNSLMLVTALNPHIGYEKSAKVAHTAYDEGISLRDACIKLGFMSGEEFDRAVVPEKMV
ncbi:MAG: class II fumarate hydratase [Clostridia bacterium]|nr:class II fumarate hydratase [Clostridia bacterium]